MLKNCLLCLGVIALVHGCASPRQRARQLTDRAERLAYADKWQEAIDGCNDALVIDRDYRYAFILRGWLKHNAGHGSADSLKDLDRGLLDGGTMETHLWRALVRYKAQMYEGAIADCDQSIRYANAKGFSPALIERQRASGKTVTINLGGEADRYYAKKLAEAKHLRGLAETAAIGGRLEKAQRFRKLARIAATEQSADATQQKTLSDKQMGSMHPRYRIATTLGDIVLELDAAKAPITVQNFNAYVSSGYYDGTIFHRVMDGFMIQGGGYTADSSKKTRGLRPSIKNEWENGLKNVAGSIAMAHVPSRPDSATSQFFINLKDNESLDVPRYGAGSAVFGHVVEGMDTIRTIEGFPTHLSSGAKIKGVPVVVIKSVQLIGSNGAHVEELSLEKRK